MPSRPLRTCTRARSTARRSMCRSCCRAASSHPSRREPAVETRTSTRATSHRLPASAGSPRPPPSVAPQASGDLEDEEVEVARRPDLVGLATMTSTGRRRGASRPTRGVEEGTGAGRPGLRTPTGQTPGPRGAGVGVRGGMLAATTMEGGGAPAGTVTAVAGGVGRGRRAGAVEVEATAEMWKRQGGGVQFQWSITQAGRGQWAFLWIGLSFGLCEHFFKQIQICKAK